jgi:hypothetical protein
MRTYLTALLGGFLLLSTAWSQERASPGCLAAGCVAAKGQVCHCPDCGGAAVKICVPEPDKKKHEKVVYGAKCVDFCVKGFPGLCNRTHKDCQGCDVQNCPSCGKVYTKKVLIKKVKTTECDTYKCVPQTVCRE